MKHDIEKNRVYLGQLVNVNGLIGRVKGIDRGEGSTTVEVVFRNGKKMYVDVS